MNTTRVVPPSGTRRPRRFWRWLFVGTAILFGAVSLMAFNLVTLNRDPATLRDELVSTLSGEAHTQVQVSVGPILMGAARLVVSALPNVPEEARLALGAVRNASVGVYRLTYAATARERTEMFSAADNVMGDRGWTRVVGVNDGGSLVLVYLPTGERSGSTERVCVAVVSDEHLVVVSGGVRVDRLMDFAVQQRLIARR